MKSRFEKSEIDLLKSIAKILSTENQKILNQIITKMENVNTKDKNNRTNTIMNITEKRKEDKWYGRSGKVIQTHFNTVAKKIKKQLLNGNTKEAKYLFKLMEEEAKFPRYKLQFDNAIAENLTQKEIEFLKWEVDENGSKRN